MRGRAADRPRRRLLALGGVAAVVLVVGLVGGWALRALLAPAPDVLDSPGYTLVAAEQGTVGR